MWTNHAILPKALLSSDSIEKGLDFPDTFLYHNLNLKYQIWSPSERKVKKSLDSSRKRGSLGRVPFMVPIHVNLVNLSLDTPLLPFGRTPEKCTCHLLKERRNADFWHGHRYN